MQENKNSLKTNLLPFTANTFSLSDNALNLSQIKKEGGISS